MRVSSDESRSRCPVLHSGQSGSLSPCSRASSGVQLVKRWTLWIIGSTKDRFRAPVCGSRRRSRRSNNIAYQQFGSLPVPREQGPA